MPATAGTTRRTAPGNVGLVLLFVTAVRAGALPVWAPAVLVVALVLPVAATSMLLFSAAGALMLVLFGVLAARLLRGADGRPAPVPAAVAA